MDAVATQPGFLTRERIVAEAGFNRWLVPPCALAIHLCIGMIYGMSVFWLPMTRLIGIDHSTACPTGLSLAAALTATHCDWKVGQVSIVFTLAIVCLGASAAIWGGWLERAGPRKAALVAAICWPGGLALAALGVYLHQLWLLWLGGGLVGGVGLGLGYISPVSTLIKWFPDRRGMATGMAIMGFGGGAMIGSPLAAWLMAHFRGTTQQGVWQSLVVLAALYFIFMVSGAFGYRVPPEGYRAVQMQARQMAPANAQRSVRLEDAWRTRQFWLLWGVLCLNVSAGIGVLDMASPMLQEIFGGSLIGQTGTGFSALSPTQLKAVAGIAAGFAGFLSLFNILGRFFWASLSDRLGRRTTFSTFFLLGIVLYALVPSLAAMGSKPLFALAFGVILSMYGGGFATVPAYLADLFGTGYVGAIHGRLLTAWSAAGVIGPILVTQLREAQIAAGAERARVYDHTMYILAALLAGGLVCNLLIRPVPDRLFADIRMAGGPKIATPAVAGQNAAGLPLTFAWLAVCIPLAWGFYMTVAKAAALF